MPLSLEEKVRLLSRVDVFESLVRKELAEVARQACDTHLGRGEVMRKPQEEGDELYVLKEGRVQLYVEIPSGGEVTLSVVEGGASSGS